MLSQPFFDPEKSYEDNRDNGPFGGFKDGVVLEDAGEPRFSLFGNPISYPIGIPAGPLLNGTFVKAALDKGFDVPVHKTVRTRDRASHPWPNVLGVKVEGDLTLEKAFYNELVRESLARPLDLDAGPERRRQLCEDGAARDGFPRRHQVERRHDDRRIR